MKKLLPLILALPPAANANTILHYSDHEPLGNMRTTFLNDVLFKNIEKETHGRVKIAPQWNGELATGYNALKTVQESKADLAVIVPEYAAKELPLHQLFKGFLVGATGDKQVQFFRQSYKTIPALTDELAANKIRPLFLATGYPVAFFGAKPLNSLTDLKWQNWRTASFWHKDFLANAGTNPITMAWNDKINDALKAGTLDGLMVNIDSGYDLKVYENAPNVLTSPKLWLGHLYVIGINSETWAKLPKADQQAVIRASEKSYRTLGTVMQKSYQNQILTLQKAGASVKMIDDKSLTAWVKTTNYEQVQNTWASKQEKQGVIGATDTLNKLKNLMRKYQ